MNQYFAHYEKWEDYQNGLWGTVPKEQEQMLINSAVECLRDPEEAMSRVMNEWPISTKVNLTNKGSNRKSWLGQAACCIEYGVPENLTREAWMTGLTNAERDHANSIAKKIIDLWLPKMSNQLRFNFV